MSIPTVLLFDDDERHAPSLVAALESSLTGEATVARWQKPPEHDQHGTYEEIIAASLGVLEGRVGLLVVDRDLSLQLPGLSERTVAEAADPLGLPTARYARQAPPSDSDRLLRLFTPRTWREIEIDFNQPLEEFAGEVRSLLRGFERLLDQMRAAESSWQQGPAVLLSSALNAPEVEPHLTLYASADMTALAFARPETSHQLMARHLATFLGYWLHNVILRFPGPILNQAATASYLDIAPSDLARRDVQAPLLRAAYDGPFSGTTAFWWRHRLDAFVAESGYSSGLEALSNMGIQNLSPCPCGVNHCRNRTGYYCLVTSGPVCAEHSIGNLAWIPGGADLARIRVDKYETYAPWLGL